MKIKEMNPVFVIGAGVSALTLMLGILVLGEALGRSQIVERQHLQIHILKQTKTTQQTEIIPRGGARVQVVKCLPGAAHGAICVKG
ncbi:hypothetical protein [Acidiferrobacter sp.]|jgi:hypothetical protein|uniref:hypothetical protein n=1 Tax=Acidiferrobacter sp. TaxID=1872107 RepID=UPI002633E652|nr:hypothetical protein [Acidiferrobacter sp.]